MQGRVQNAGDPEGPETDGAAYAEDRVAATGGEATEAGKGHVVRVERSGWRVMHEAPGDPPAEVGADKYKVFALEVAVNYAEALAEEIGGEVELHEEDGRGRPVRTRYYKPKPPAKPKKGGKK